MVMLASSLLQDEQGWHHSQGVGLWRRVGLRYSQGVGLWRRVGLRHSQGVCIPHARCGCHRGTLRCHAYIVTILFVFALCERNLVIHTTPHHTVHHTIAASDPVTQLFVHCSVCVLHQSVTIDAEGQFHHHTKCSMCNRETGRKQEGGRKRRGEKGRERERGCVCEGQFLLPSPATDTSSHYHY